MIPKAAQRLRIYDEKSLFNHTTLYYWIHLAGVIIKIGNIWSVFLKRLGECFSISFFNQCIQPGEETISNIMTTFCSSETKSEICLFVDTHC